MAIGILLELNIADTIEEAEKMIQEVRPEVQIHPEFIKDLKKLYRDK